MSQRKILNLGSGPRTSPYCTNVDWSMALRLGRSRAGARLAAFVVRGERLERLRALSGEIMVHDLRKGIPAESSSVDAVYHSHVLEHLDREVAEDFLAEIWRVLRPGGVHRVVVPDLALACRQYLSDLEACMEGRRTPDEHDEYVAAMIEQMVRREAFGTSQQPAFRRWLENALLGDARRRGETHQWMYDQVNLSHVLRRAGFRDITVVGPTVSSIEGWDAIALDTADDGGEHKPGSLYMEGTK